MSENQQATLVKLNVGGVLHLMYEVTLKKLLLFKNLLETEMQNNEKADSGEIFVDRCGKLFEHVLRYSRNGTMRLNKPDVELLEYLFEEAEFYQIEEMKKIDIELKKKENKEENLSFIPVDNYMQKFNCLTDIVHIKNFSDKYKARSIVECSTAVRKCIKNIPNHTDRCIYYDLDSDSYDNTISIPAKYYLVTLKKQLLSFTY
ncbi:hypothetical protein CU097_012132 [Rhizopus azygosporus]|uniref:BTB domain-containing protein n=1 Tax=Rhizopus azygosporus TaxID=86630 RepID=A0A367K7G0_RHIAZ|nr:hypothetical protein CU097_012132 [Rhizopus azygosporus]